MVLARNLWGGKKNVKCIIIALYSKPFYALNGFRMQISETIPNAKWF
jgi:hypothetical protein